MAAVVARPLVRNRVRRLFGLIALSLAFSSCCLTTAPYPTPTPTVTPSPTPPPTPLVDYLRSGGIAGVDDHLVIRHDGSYEMQRKAAKRSGAVAAAELAELRTLVQQLASSRLEGRFMPADTCCDRMQYSLSYWLEGRKYTIETMDGAVPSALEPVTASLDRIFVVAGAS